MSKLVVLDLNGILLTRKFAGGMAVADFPENAYVVDNHLIWKRPGLDDFLEYVCENFTVAVWSSMRKYNIDKLIPLIFGTNELLFVWGQERCWRINEVYLKALEAVWDEYPQFDESSTLLIDDSPEKVVKNPKGTAFHGVEFDDIMDKLKDFK